MTTNATALALTFLIASSTELVSAQDTLACSYKVDFPLGVKAEDIVRQHFDSLKLSYNIRVASNTQFANFVSFTINNGCDYTTQVATIPQATQFNKVQTVPGPGPVDPSVAGVSASATGDVQVGPVATATTAKSTAASTAASTTATTSAKSNTALGTASSLGSLVYGFLWAFFV